MLLDPFIWIGIVWDPLEQTAVPNVLEFSLSIFHTILRHCGCQYRQAKTPFHAIATIPYLIISDEQWSKSMQYMQVSLLSVHAGILASQSDVLQVIFAQVKFIFTVIFIAISMLRQNREDFGCYNVFFLANLLFGLALSFRIGSKPLTVQENIARQQDAALSTSQVELRCQVILAKIPFEVLSQFDFLIIVTIKIFQFNHNLSF